MFNTILVANRGEIACRIIKTAKAMGIRTIAIYSSIDKDSLHVKLADNAFCVGEAEAKDSYLNGKNIIEAAIQSGSQAIHPGYGFLSENPGFAATCREAGLVFIGPGVDAMIAMASKQLSKQRLEQSKVPLIPGYHGEDQSLKRLLLEAKQIGFPVLIKAANGGGGKGMRAVYEVGEFKEALAGAKRESLASFADDTVILEKLLRRPRHIEVQIVADNDGNVIPLFERDCSIQRRHQKIIEEARAIGLSDSLREKLYQAATDVARSIGYRNAGTVEFLVDEHEHFYFMEMNTRLQVEHPVTELITGLDLVALQFKIAAGDSLAHLYDIKPNGHAIECRIYAEDPFNHFIPSIGKIQYLREPQVEGIRLDTGIGQDSVISKYYDPMLAKLISYGTTREMALQRMQAALKQYCIGGIKTNIPFLQAICNHPQFKQGTIQTDFLDKENIIFEKPEPYLALLMTIAFDYRSLTKSIQDPLFQDTFAWQSNQLGSWTWRYQNEDNLIEMLITPVNTQEFKVQQKSSKAQDDAGLLNDKIHTLRVQLFQEQLIVEIDSEVHKAFVENQAQQLTLYTEKGPINIERYNWNKTDERSQKGQLTAPMPATVVAVLKNIGEAVKAGDSLIILEAMKMEHTIEAPQDGILEAIFYSVGSQVDEGAKLLALRVVED